MSEEISKERLERELAEAQKRLKETEELIEAVKRELEEYEERKSEEDEGKGE